MARPLAHCALHRTRLALAAGLATGLAPAQDLAYPAGVNQKIHEAIGRGLEYLSRNQANNGSWLNAGGYGSYPVAMTSLAGMALVGSGSTPTRGKYWREVRDATDFVMRSADRSTGVICVPVAEARSMYSHGFATMFLAQVYGMEEDIRRQERLHGILTRAVRLIASSQSSAGGWLYTPDSTGDEGSVTITQLQSLRACRNAGITVPIKTVQGAVEYVRKSANPDGSIRYRATRGGSGRAPLSAAAVAVLYNAGRYDDPLAGKALEYAKRHLPVNGSGNRHHYYSQLYLSQGMYQHGGEDWDDYYRRMAAWLLKQQKRDGSWMGDGVGTVYGTSVALTILQLPYSMVPIYQR